MDELTRWIDRDTELRAVAADATQTCLGLCALHNVSGLVASQFCNAIVGGLLMASDLKGMQTLSLQVELGTNVYHVDATREGMLRAMVTTRSHESSAGRVFLRRFGQQGLIYQSVIDVAAAHPEEALAEYLRRSDQQNVVLDSHVDLESATPSVTGYLLRGFPSTPPELLTEFHDRWLAARAQASVKDPLNHLQWRTWDRLDHIEVGHYCPCSEDRVRASLLALGKAEIVQAAEEEKSFDVQCDFCCSQYSIEAKSLLGAFPAD